MRAILVDDERLALRQLKKLLESRADDIEIIGMYADPTEVAPAVKELEPDVVFLDIHMPGMNGLELGEMLQGLQPSLNVVFVTGYDQYAVQAFELYALDYVMKPISANRLIKTMERIRARAGAMPLASGPEKGLSPVAVVAAPRIDYAKERADGENLSLRLCCFGRLRYCKRGEAPQPFKWRTSKAQELFAYLLHHRDRLVDRDTLIELLWPGFDMIRAAQQLYTTVYHIRQTLRSSGLGMLEIANASLGAGYRMSTGGLLTDSEIWEKRLQGLGVLDAANAADYERVLDLYEGDYLGEYDYVWAEHERERLRRLWLHHAKSLGELYDARNQTAAAIRVGRRIQQLFPYEEDNYFTLMKLYASKGDAAGVEEQYLLLSLRMAEELEAAVSEPISNWYGDWRAKRA